MLKRDGLCWQTWLRKLYNAARNRTVGQVNETTDKFDQAHLHLVAGSYPALGIV